MERLKKIKIIGIENTSITTNIIMANQEELKKELYYLSSAARLALVLGIFIGLFIDNAYSNLIFGAVAGCLLYPLIEYFMRIVSD
jgi:hypothetical protein